MTAVKQFFGTGWATPVVKRRWAVVASVTQIFKRLTGYRFFATSHARSWERAVGIR